MIQEKNAVMEFIFKYGLYVMFVLIIAVFALSRPHFLHLGNINNMLLHSSAWSVAVTGLVFVMLTGGIDISTGSNMYFTAYICVVLTTSLAVIPDTIPGIIALIFVAMFIGGVLGSVNGFFVAFVKVPPLIVTLATLGLFRGVTFMINNVTSVVFNNNVNEYLGRGRIFDFFPVITVIMIITVMTGQFILRYTKFGRQLYAIGNNEHSARQIGIPVDRIKFMVYAICGATAGLSGLLIGAQTNAIVTNFAAEHHFIIISCAVLGGVSLFGGRGTIFPGAFIGILIVVIIETGLVFLGADPYFYAIVRGAIIFLAVMMDCIKNKSELR